MKVNGGYAVVKSLKDFGVKVVFGLPEVHIMQIYNALYHSRIRHILVRHEQSAAFMADAYSRVTGEVCRGKRSYKQCGKPIPIPKIMVQNIHRDRLKVPRHMGKLLPAPNKHGRKPNRQNPSGHRKTCVSSNSNKNVKYSFVA